jgi:hypothetical protein
MSDQIMNSQLYKNIDCSPWQRALILTPQEANRTHQSNFHPSTSRSMEDLEGPPRMHGEAWIEHYLRWNPYFTQGELINDTVVSDSI